MRRYEPYFYVSDRPLRPGHEWSAMRSRSFFAYSDAMFATVWASANDKPADVIQRANDAVAAGIIFG